ncbi:substrate import-associated zinc metallohydrolase lipoprotein [Pedobacter nototheniae]|uniref:substrate import-associated zinc metallohydrolase lipoprotein n=1 Tax=Pedobacter nototheniae TaxID=2488994 RepID=UPI00103AB0D2|nr:substrate import-associated zinc metallohydrolase lipoprotein [Pedobacter nototheniae]
MKTIYKLTFTAFIVMSITISACKKNDVLDEKAPVDFLTRKIGVKNDLDKLIDTISDVYGVKAIYQFDPRVIDPSTFYTPTSYDKAMLYTKYVIRKLWLEPATKNYPSFIQNQKPVEFLIIGSGIHFNSFNPSDATGAGLNGQFFRLGIGSVDNLSFTKKGLREHICILYHEHAHQMDNKYGRGYAFDRVSQGTYYQLNYNKKSDSQALKDGFFRAYGGFAPEEDFATAVEAMIRYSKADILTQVAQNPKLETKYKMVYKFYLDRGIDLHKMHDILDQVASTLPLN